MDLNQILNTDSSWNGGRSSLHRPKPLRFTSSSHDLAIHQKSHPVNAYSLRPQSEHKRNDTVYPLPSISSFDVPPRILSGVYFGPHQYESEQLCRSFSRYSAPRQSDFNGVQPVTSFAPTTYASTHSSSSDNSLTLGDLHIRPPRGVFDPSFSFQEEHTDTHQGYQPAIVSGVSSRVTTSHEQQTSYRGVETTPSNHSSTEVSPRTMPVQLPVANADPLPFDGPKRCTFLENCSTESPERKVTSHLFGRNKNCTKRIPNGVWLWYCRKHYQRTRYRDRIAFTRLQLDSVRRQVNRLESWGGVLEWQIILKKSEQERLDAENAELAKIALEDRLRASDGSIGGDDRRNEAGSARPRAILEAEPSTNLVNKHMQSEEKHRDGRDNQDDEDDEFDSDDEDDKMSKKSKRGKKNQKKKKKQKQKTEQELPPVCRWMVPYLGRGKTFQDIRVVLNVIETYLRQTKYPFPAIEILPLSAPPAGSRRASCTTRRRCNPQPQASGRRKASDSTSESSDMTPPTSRKRRSPAEDNSDESGDRSTASPRKRRSVAGVNANDSNTMPVPSPSKRRSVAASNTTEANTMPPPSPPARRTLTRGRKTQPVAARPVKQGKQAAKRGAATGGGRR